ncbi:hypothetical protein pb186bvf_010641 [Paramecium bursaria]
MISMLSIQIINQKYHSVRQELLLSLRQELLLSLLKQQSFFLLQFRILNNLSKFMQMLFQQNFPLYKGLLLIQLFIQSEQQFINNQYLQ